MHIEDIFEDLEAQFDAVNEKMTRDSFTANAKVIELKAASVIPRELIAPIIGVDFIAGLDPVNPIWHLFPMRYVSRVVFHDVGDAELPRLRNFSVDFADFVQTLPMPCSIRWRVDNADDLAPTDGLHWGQLHRGKLHSATANLLFIYTDSQSKPIAVPIKALKELSIESVDNLDGVF
jgi:hypothetical protein